MYAVGVDTSNYATSLAVFCTDTKEVVCAKKRFLPVKTGQLGLRQSDAVFHHTQALPEMLIELQSEFDLSRVSVVGVSQKPRPIDGSYMPCFSTGVLAAQSLALGANATLIKTTHQQGHIVAALYATGNYSLFKKQTLVFHVSGGTTELLLCQNGNVLKKVGESTDLYAGQAVDRIGVKLGFDFPAGVQMSQIAQKCNELIVPKVSVKGTNCSLSGLENQCNKLMENGAQPEYVAKYCLCAVGETIKKMIVNAKKDYPNANVVCAGGVMSSAIIKEQVQAAMKKVYFVSAEYASDNAIGVAIIAAISSGEINEWQM